MSIRGIVPKIDSNSFSFLGDRIGTFDTGRHVSIFQVLAQVLRCQAHFGIAASARAYDKANRLAMTYSDFGPILLEVLRRREDLHSSHEPCGTQAHQDEDFRQSACVSHWTDLFISSAVWMAATSFSE